MSHIIPYISTEPPSIHDDSFENESVGSEISDFNCNKVSSVSEIIETKENDVTERTDQSFDVTGFEISGDQDHEIKSETFSANHSETASQSSLELRKHIDNIIENADIKSECSVDNRGDAESRSPLELRQHIDNVMANNDLLLDVTDSRINGDQEDDVISQCSFEGQFDAYIDNVTNPEPINNVHESVKFNDSCEPMESAESYFVNPFNPNDGLNQPNPFHNNNPQDNDSDFGDFGEFSMTADQPVDYFTDNSSHMHENNPGGLSTFADFHFTQTSIDVTDFSGANVDQEVDDDFDDFATFNDEPTTIGVETTYPINELPIENLKPIDDIVESFRQKLLKAVDSVDIQTTPSSLQSQKNQADLQSSSVIFNPALTSDYGAQIWKELTNFDYSPAFIFHWMQSTSYENFMNSMGPDYKELLSAQRATLPLYSVNLTPIEPVPVDSFVHTIHSTTSSNLDLTVPDKSGNNQSSKNSNIDIKNLEDEFIFNTTLNENVKISYMKSDNRSSMPNLSSAAVIQSDGFGGIIKSMLKPLNPGKISSTTSTTGTSLTNNNKPMNAQTEAVLKELPDLSYMTSKVLMFPVLASCDIEDNI